jgi:hypothetical protein
LRDAQTEIASRGARLVVIGNGTPHQARDLIEDLDYHGTLWVDPDMVAYRAAGLERGLAKALSLKMFGHAVRAMRAGHRQKGVQGDPWQMGGTFVIAPHDAVLFAHVSGEAGDHPDLADVLAALELSSP